MNALRSFIRYANEGNIRKSQPDDQANQAACLTLVTNIIVVWNTRYMGLIVDNLMKSGQLMNEEDLSIFPLADLNISINMEN